MNQELCMGARESGLKDKHRASSCTFPFSLFFLVQNSRSGGTSPSGAVTNTRLQLFLACILLTTGVFAQSSTNEPRIACAAPNYDFGKMCNTALVTHIFLLANEGTAPLAITSLNSGCGCTVAKSSVTAVGPGSNTEVTVKFDTANRTGPQRKSIYVQSNDRRTPTLRLELTGDLFGSPVLVRPFTPVVAGSGPVPTSVGTVVPTVRGRLGDTSLPKTDTLTDLYTIPTELTLVMIPGQTNTVCRYLAIRSRC
jgi:hypothetical protein